MWPSKATCARDRTRHATACGVRRAASPSSPSRLLPTSPALLPPLLVAVIAFGFVDCHGLRLNHRRDPLPSVTAADRRRHRRWCPPFPLSFSFRPPPASPSSSSSSSLSSTVVPFSPAKPLPLPPSHRRFSPQPIPPPPSPGSSPVRQWELGSTVCSPSPSIADHPASATVPSPTLPLYSLSLSPSPTAVTPQPLPLHLLLRFRLRPSTPVTKTERRHRPLLPLHLTAVAPFPLPPPVAGSHRPDALPFRLLPHPATLLLPFPVATASFIAGTAVFLPGKAMT